MAQGFQSHKNWGTNTPSVDGGHIHPSRNHSPQVSATRQPMTDTSTIRQPLSYQSMLPPNFPFGTDLLCGHITQSYTSDGIIEMGYNTGLPGQRIGASNGTFTETQPLAPFPDPQITMPGSSSIGEPFLTSSVNIGRISREPQLDLRNKSKLRCEWKGCVYRNIFNRPADLIRHVKTIHVLPHSFTCDIPGCERSFSRKDNFMEHKLRVHHFVRRP